MSRLRSILPLAAALTAFGAPATAHALTVDVQGPTLRVTAGPFETNRITVGVTSGKYVVRDDGTVVSQLSTSGISALRVDLGDLDDTLTIAPEVTVGATLIDGPGNDTVTGGAKKDTFVGSPGDDTLLGGAGDDTFGDAGGTGADTIDGGAGWDVADLSGRTADLHVALDDVRNDGQAGEDDDIRATVEQVDGGAGSDRLVGSDGPNTLRGNRGDDSFDGRGGADTYAGGDGQDAADYRARSTRVVVSADGTANDGAPGENDNVGGDVDDLYGGTGDDELIGNSWWSTVDGGAGDDTLRAGGGDDTVVGGPGADTVQGGDGSDRLSGNEGDDTLQGGSGDDTLDGGSGADALDGGAGTDVLDYRTRSGAITVDLAAGTAGEAGEGRVVERREQRGGAVVHLDRPHGAQLTRPDAAGEHPDAGDAQPAGRADVPLGVAHEDAVPRTQPGPV
ncbi:MAG TPA: calcium-binding protein, partial [Solirubrobacteraceae bacterium]|nr:calcium-binding protein [Solirubrobacteraceae bacterium]